MVKGSPAYSIRLTVDYNIFMGGSIKKNVSIISLLITVFFASFALAADKVVVVPLSGSKAAGVDGQLQYNDSGKEAGAEVYYDKESSHLGIGTTFTDTKLVVQGDGSSWSEGFISLKNNNHDAGIRIYDGMYTIAHHIFNSNFENDLLRIAPTGNYDEGIALQQNGNVGIGTRSPVTKLEVSSVIRLTPTDTPGVCDPTTVGAMYFDATLNLPCFCDGTGWQQFNGGGGC